MKTSVGNSWFVEQLVLTSVQLVGKVGDTGIPVLPQDKVCDLMPFAIRHQLYIMLYGVYIF